MSVFRDGQELTAGSLNLKTVRLVEADVTIYNEGTSGTDITVVDTYINSGTVALTNRILIMANASFKQTANLNVESANFRIKIGPSGTTPTLTTVGSLTIQSQGISGESDSPLQYGTMIGIGSTTVDDSATPALVRFSKSQPVTSNRNSQIAGFVIFSVE